MGGKTAASVRVNENKVWIVLAKEEIVSGRVAVVDIQVKSGETIHLTPIFDAHLDDSLCDFGALKNMVAERESLSHHYAIFGGDTFNLVVPPDLRRYRPSGQPAGIVGRDDWLNATIDYVGNRIESLNVKPILFIPGNHEDEFEKRYGLDVTSILANRFHCARGGYSGILDIRLHLRQRVWTTFRIVYHHGAWGGKYSKGYLGAHTFFSQIDGWHVALFGHNHASRVDPEIRKKVEGNELIEYPVHIVNCGSWVQSYSDDPKQTHYAERKGYIPQPRTCPLIKVQPVEHHITNRKNKLKVHYTVSV